MIFQHIMRLVRNFDIIRLRKYEVDRKKKKIEHIWNFHILFKLLIFLLSKLSHNLYTILSSSHYTHNLYTILSSSHYTHTLHTILATSLFILFYLLHPSLYYLHSLTLYSSSLFFLSLFSRTLPKLPPSLV